MFEDLTSSEKRFVRKAIKARLEMINESRQNLQKEGKFTALLESENELAEAESAWTKVKGSL